VRIGVFSDVHGNLEALELVLKALEKEGVDSTICSGDLVGYGPNPNQCVEKVMETADEIVAGNHDYAATGLTSINDFTDYARSAIEWTQDVLTSISQSHLSSLSLIKYMGEVTIVHATPDSPSEWKYIFTFEDINRCFEALTTTFCFIGHSHVPVAFIRDSKGNIFYQNATDVVLESGKKYIINVGSVGQPRDGDPRASYGVLDLNIERFYLKRLEYSVEKVQEKMWKQGLPPYLIYRLETGV
jgi:predicted phosphodiesterase